MNEQIQHFKTVKDSQDRVKYLSVEKEEMQKKVSEMNPEEWKMRVYSLEVDILNARGNIYEAEEKLGLDRNDPEVIKIQEEAFKEIDELDKEMIKTARIAGKTPEDKEIEESINFINNISDILHNAGYTLDEFEKLKYSENEEGVKIYNEMTKALEDFDFENRWSVLEKNNPNDLLDGISELKSDDFKLALLDGISNSKVSNSKLIDTIYKTNLPIEKTKSVTESIETKINSKKVEAIEKFPAEEILTEIGKDKYLNVTDKMKEKIGNLFQKSIESSNNTEIQNLIDKLKNLELDPSNFFPSWLRNMNKETAIKAMKHELLNSEFDDAFRYSNYVPIEIVPKELQTKYADKSFQGYNISLNAINKYLEVTNSTFDDLDEFKKSKVFNYLGPDIPGMKFGIEEYKKILESNNYIDLLKIPIGERMGVKNILNTEKKLQLLREDKSQIKGMEFNFDDYKNIFEDNASLTDSTIIKKIPVEYLVNLKDSFPTLLKLSIINNYEANYLKDLGFSIVDYRNSILTGNYINPEHIPIEFRSSLKENFSPTQKLRLFEQNLDKIEGMEFDLSDFQEIVKITYINTERIPIEFRNEVENLVVSTAKKELIFNSRTEFISNVAIREGVFNSFCEDIQNAEVNDSQEALEQSKKYQKMKNIKESFNVLDNQEKLPQQIIEKLEIFKQKYGKKGEGLISLGIVAYGIDSPDEYIQKMDNIEKVLDKYNNENIPNGAHVSQGIEYEVGQSIGKEYNMSSQLDYNMDINLVNMSSHINAGGGGGRSIHEIANKPTDNPYVLLAEVKLLQDAGFLDFNFKKYPNASHGYHLSLGGENGLSADSKDMIFLNNVLTATNLTGIMSGIEVSNVKEIHSKNLNRVFENQLGNRVEFKGMGCDSFEQFERTVITTHNAGIATQVAEKYLHDANLYTLINQLPDDFDKFEEFIIENNLLKSTFDSKQEEEITFEWLKFKKEMNSALKQHNESFGKSEFMGGFIDSKNNYIDTGDSIDYKNNTEKLGGIKVDSDEFNKLFNIPGDMSKLFYANDVSAIIRTNNLFIFKEPRLSDNKLYVDKNGVKQVKPEFMTNAYSMLTSMQGEGYKKDIPGSPFESIFDRGGEIRNGYYPIQNVSEEMFTHKSQILLNKFNLNMKKLLENPVEIKSKKEQEIYES